MNPATDMPMTDREKLDKVTAKLQHLKNTFRVYMGDSSLSKEERKQLLDLWTIRMIKYLRYEEHYKTKLGITDEDIAHDDNDIFFDEDEDDLFSINM